VDADAKTGGAPQQTEEGAQSNACPF